VALAFPDQWNVCGPGKVQHKEFAAFLGASFANLAAYREDGSIYFVCMDWRQTGPFMERQKLSRARMR